MLSNHKMIAGIENDHQGPSSIGCSRRVPRGAAVTLVIFAEQSRVRALLVFTYDNGNPSRCPSSTATGGRIRWQSKMFPLRTDEHIVPRSQWLQIGKSNLLFDAQKIQKNPIFQISYDEKTWVYCCQVDEQWFNLSAGLLRKALDIIPVNPAHPFELPPTGNTVIDFVNQLGHSSSSYHPKYWKWLAKKRKKTPQDSVSKQPEPATKRAPPKKPTTTTPVKPTKPPSSKQPKSPTKKPSKRKLPQKVRKGKPSFQLVDEDDEAQQESVPQGESDDPALELAKKMSLDAHQEKEEGEGVDADIERAIKLSLDPSFLPEGQAPVGGVAISDPKKRPTDQFYLVRRDQAPHDSTTEPSSQPEDDTSEKVDHESSSSTDSEQTESETEAATPKGDKEQDVTHAKKRRLDWKELGKVHVSLAGPNPEHMDEEFLATAYPKVHENLKLITDERVIEDNPESHSGSMSSMKNLEDTDNFGDQFLYDKPTEDEQEKSKGIDESDSTIPDLSHQTDMLPPPVIAPVIDFSSLKLSS
ncbi:hypothetical protein Tco_1562023 [Tanacetum coccineum]